MGNEYFNMAVQNANDEFGQVIAISKSNPWDKYIAEVSAMVGILSPEEIERLSVLFAADVKAKAAAREIIEGK